MNEKTDLRIKFKELRKSFDLKQISSQIVQNVKNCSFYQSANNIMIYYPTKFEINLLDLTNDTNKNFYLPKVSGKELFVCPYDFKSELISSKFNILEPCTQPVNPECIDLIIVPALAVDKRNFRLGYGGGFYDRFLSKYNEIKTIVPISSMQIVEKLPVEEFDVPIDIVIHEKGLIVK